MKRIITVTIILLLTIGCIQHETSEIKNISDTQSSQLPQPMQNITAQNQTQPISTQPNLTASQGNQENATDDQTMVRGIKDPDFEIIVYDKNSSLFGTTIFADNHVETRPRVVEVNMLGEIIWEYVLPEDVKMYTNPGFDVEPLSNGNVLILLPRKGVFEINRNKTIVWQYYDSKISHDADRLPNGNTLIVFGANDKKEDIQVKEIDISGKIVWSWYAKSAFDKEPYASISDEGWTHTNAVTRLSNGNTLINFRNFNLLAEVNPTGTVVKTIENTRFEKQHDPEVQSNGTIIMANHIQPNEIIITSSDGKSILWQFIITNKSAWPLRDANILSNGNILVTGADRIFECTYKKEIVWELRLKNASFDKITASSRGFYKSERKTSQITNN